MAPHSNTLAWKIPWLEEPGGLQFMLRVGHNWATSLSLFTFIGWRRKWQPTPVFLLGESQGRGSLLGCRLWGGTELDTTEVTQQQHLYVGIASFAGIQLWGRKILYLDFKKLEELRSILVFFNCMLKQKCLKILHLCLIVTNLMPKNPLCVELWTFASEQG